MIESVAFVKFSGSGNDFICIDARDGHLADVLDSPRAGRMAASLCRRGRSVGADGVIFATHPEIEGVSDIAARFFEPDGSEAELCGNGTACFVYWVAANGWAGDGEIKILTPAGVVRGYRADGQYVRVCIPDPEQMQCGLSVEAAGRTWACDFVITGVPHAITYVDDVDAVDVARFGPALRRHECFAPRGANANFVQVLAVGSIAVRTFEFGVEAETLSCGTGSASAAILTTLREDWPAEYRQGRQPVLVRARSGDVLKVWFTADDGGAIRDVCLETTVRRVYAGRLDGDHLAAALAGPAGGEPAG